MAGHGEKRFGDHIVTVELLDHSVDAFTVEVAMSTSSGFEMDCYARGCGKSIFAEGTFD